MSARPCLGNIKAFNHSLTLVFFGSSEFSLEALRAALESGQRVLLVLTTPPQKKGRGLKLSPTPVEEFARAQGLAVEAPASLKDEALIERVRRLAPEVFLVSSYGKFIPSAWLKIPGRVSLNVHPSLLPKYRGAAPVNWPILNGDAETGISIAEVTSELDAGDLFYQKRMALAADTDSETLSRTLAALSREAVQTVLKQVEGGALRRTPQDGTKSSYARKLTKGDGALDLKEPAEALARRVRGLLPWPRAGLVIQGEPVQVLRASVAADDSGAKPGQITAITAAGIHVKTGKGALVLGEVQPAGKKAMEGRAFANGKRLLPGASLL